MPGSADDAPSAELRDPDAGGTQYLSEAARRVVVIDFWATWCHVCTDEMKYFVRAQQLFGPSIKVVTVSNEPHDVAASYFRLWNIELPVVEDLEGARSPRPLFVSAVPVTLVLDPAGDVSYVSVGGLSWTELVRAIDRRALCRDSACFR